MPPDSRRLMGYLPEVLLLATHTGIILYWAAVLTDLFPQSMRRDYSNAVVQAWNLSFLPLDVTAALAVYLGLYLASRGRASADRILMAGLTLTFCAGIMAISFWSFYCDFSLFWWSMNAWLMIVPVVAFVSIMRNKSTGRALAERSTG